MNKQLFYFLFFFFINGLLYAQKTDSLLQLLPNTKDTQRVQVLNALCSEYTYNDPNKGKLFALEALQVAEQINYTLGKARALNRIGIIYDVSGNYDSAIDCYLQAGIAFSQANNIRGKGAALNNIGMVYSVKGNYKKALVHHFEALKIFESINDEPYAASALNNIANVYADLSKYKLAFTYYLKASVINKKTGDNDALASNYTNIASSLRECNQPDSALFYVNKSLDIQLASNNQYGLGILYTVVGNIYGDKNQHKQSLYYLLKSLQIRNELNDEAGKASVLINISGQYTYLNNKPLAEKYALQAHEIALRINSYRMLRKTSMLLFNLYTRAGEYKKAVQYVDIAIMARDSAMNEESNKNMAEMEAKYESEKQILELEKKDLALNNATLEIEQKRSTITLLVIACLFIVLLGFGIYNFTRNKQQRALDAHLIAQQELRNKAIIEAEEKERVRIARELHDGIGQQLSAAKMNLSAFEATMPEDKKETFHYLMELVDDAVKEVRSISHNMIPNALLRSGLTSAVREFVNKLTISGDLKIDLHIVGIDTRLDNSIETVLYRVIQECVSNIIKHAQASHVNIQLIKYDTHLNLVIEDNGVGFDTNKINDFEGIGLKNIVSRVLYLNGTVDFDSMSGHGTTIIVDVPTNKV
ncbi:MAG: sensor histidine kinase [Bacteroidota bacterium]